MIGKPTIFLAFANAPQNSTGFLSALKQERKQLQQVLGHYMQKDWGIYHMIPDAEPHGLARDLQEWQQQIVIFHFAGHGSKLKLELEDGDQSSQSLHRSNLQSLLKGAANLKLVFLNACATQGHIEHLQRIGVPAIIATNEEIGDKAAAAFSEVFYRALVAGETLIDGFNKAKAAALPGDGRPRVYSSVAVSKRNSEFAWGLYCKDREVQDWSLQIAAKPTLNSFWSSMLSFLSTQDAFSDAFATLRDPFHLGKQVMKKLEVEKQGNFQAIMKQLDVELGIEVAMQVFYRYVHDPQFCEINILGAEERRLQTFSMQHFYVDLSYINKEELSRHDALRLNEKESYQQKNARRILYHNALSHNTISEDILQHHQRVVIMGNPGTGKSTFAKWLCWNWASRKRFNLPYFPLYINLRELDFDRDNTLLNYLQRTYLSSSRRQYGSLEGFIRDKSEVILWLLDGLDEIGTEQKNRLWQDLRQFSTYNKYLVFTRPYGLIGQTFPYDITLEIIGFNESTRNEYLHAFLSGQPGTKTLILDILETIEHNPVLKDFSYNPLMLSYMVLVYLITPNPQKVLGTIESAYELQENLLRWLQKYYQSKGFSRPFRKLLQEGQAMAYEMELAGLFLYNNHEVGDRFELASVQLSMLGVGRREELEFGKWRFNFNTITFQEFLAAKEVGPKISAEALVYLLQDELKWNFARMLVGYLALHKQLPIIAKVLTELHQQFVSSSHRYYQYLWLYLLGELPTRYMSQLLDEDGLAEIIDSYIQIPSNSEWESLMIESIGRLFAKLQPPHKRHLFQDLLIARMDEVLRKIYVQDNTEGTVVYSDRLLARIGVLKEPRFLQKILHLTIKVLDRILLLYEKLENADKIEELMDDSMVLENEISGYFRVLQSADEEILRRYFKESLKKLFERIPVGMETELVKLLALALTPEELFQKITEKELELSQVPEIAEDCEDEELILQKSALLGDLAGRCYALAFALKVGDCLADENYRQEITRRLVQIEKELDKTCYLLYAAEMVEIAFQWIIVAKEQLQPYISTEAILDTLYRFNIEEMVEVESQDQFEQTIEELLHQLETSYDTTTMERLSQAFTYTKQGQERFYQYRERYFRQFQRLLEVEKESFEQAYTGFRPDNYTHLASQGTNILNSLQTLLLFDHDKKYFFDRIFALKLDQIPFIALDFLPKALGKRFAFYELSYWNFLKRLVEQDASFKVLDILHNSWCFTFSTNLRPLEEVWLALEKKLPKLREKAIEANQLVLYRSAYRSLKAYKNLGDAQDSENLPYLIGRILEKNGQYSVKLKDTWVTYEYLAHALIYYYTGLESDLPAMPLQALLPTRATSIYPELSQCFNYEELAAVEPVLGPDLYQNCSAYLKAHHRAEVSFDDEVFRQRLLFGDS